MRVPHLHFSTVGHLSTIVAWMGFVLPPGLALAQSGAGLSAAPSADWQWSAPLAQAVARAKRRKLLLLVTSRRQSPCPRAAEPGGRVSRSNQLWCVDGAASVAPDAVRLAYEADSGEGRHVCQRYNIVVFPTLVLVGPDAVEIGRVSDLGVAQEVTAQLRDLISGDGSLVRLEARVRDTPNDLALRLRLLRRLALRGQVVRFEAHFARILALDSTDARGYAGRAMLLYCDIVLFRSLGDARAAQSCLRDLLARYPRSEVIPRARQCKVRVASALAPTGR